MDGLQKHISILLLFAAFSSTATSNEISTQSKVVSADDIKWGYLNPLRGDKSPGAAELWGDRTKDIATGMLVKFNKGFSSPDHIHNISYRGIVIDGLMHNDDPSAKNMWMPTGSFWTQPAGENHITAANGDANLIYLEIDTGPYLVKPSDKSFNNGENPVNLHRSNLVWLNANDLAAIEEDSGVEISPLWGSTTLGELGGALLKIPAGFSGKLNVDAKEFRAVIIKGQAKYKSAENTNSQALNAGSYFSSTGAFEHLLSLSQDALIYVRTNGSYRILSD